MIRVAPYPEWPTWLQWLVMVPNCLLMGWALWGWWPKSKQEWRKFSWVLVYLIAFFSMMIFVFHLG